MTLRTKIAIISVLCLAIAGLLWLFPEQFGSITGIMGALVKVGAVMFVLWLALPELQKVPIWLGAAIGIGAVTVAIYSRLALIIIPLLIIIWFVRPRNPTNPLTTKKKKAARKDSPEVQQKKSISKESTQ